MGKMIVGGKPGGGIPEMVQTENNYSFDETSKVFTIIGPFTRLPSWFCVLVSDVVTEMSNGSNHTGPSVLEVDLESGMINLYHEVTSGYTLTPDAYALALVEGNLVLTPRYSWRWRGNFGRPVLFRAIL